ncbi:MAG: response regulator transcription factor, partial [Anaerolineales bacterium]
VWQTSCGHQNEKMSRLLANLPLSPREMEVLSYLSLGQSNKEIAHHLGISHQTVKNHLASLFRKLGVEDRTQAVVYALQRGWVQVDSIRTKE